MCVKSLNRQRNAGCCCYEHWVYTGHCGELGNNIRFWTVCNRLRGTEMPTPKVPDNRESTHSETLVTGRHCLSGPGKGELTSFCLSPPTPYSPLLLSAEIKPKGLDACQGSAELGPHCHTHLKLEKEHFSYLHLKCYLLLFLHLTSLTMKLVSAKLGLY